MLYYQNVNEGRVRQGPECYIIKIEIALQIWYLAVLVYDTAQILACTQTICIFLGGHARLYDYKGSSFTAKHIFLVDVVQSMCNRS